LKRAKLVMTLTGLLCVSPFAWGDDFAGAERVIQEVRDYKPSGAGGGLEQKKADPGVEWGKKVDVLTREVDGLAPGVAVSRWLALYDQLLLPSTQPVRSGWSGRRYWEGEVSFRHLMGALPKAEAWPELMAQAEKREIKPGTEGVGDLCLLFLAHVLMNEQEKQLADVKKLVEQAKVSEKGYGSVGYLVLSLRGSIEQRFPKDAANAFEASLEGGNAEGAISVPNLVDLVGVEKARELLTKALGTENVLTFISENQTSVLAREIAEKDLGKLKRAQWGLIKTMNSGALFEAMLAKFPIAKTKAKVGRLGVEEPVRLAENAFSRDGKESWVEAADFYVAGLVAKGKVDEALAFLKEYPFSPDDWRSYTAIGEQEGVLERYVDAFKVMAFFEKLTEENPSYPVWDRFILAGARTGKSQVVIDRIKRLMETPGTDSEVAERVKGKLSEAMLAGVQTQDALGQMLEEFKAAPGAFPRRDRGFYARAVKVLAVAEQAADAKVQDEVVVLLTGVLEQAQAEEETGELLGRVVWHEIGKKRGQKAEALLKRELIKVTFMPVVEEKQNAGRGGDREYYRSENAERVLEHLMQVYFVSGRYGDVLRVVDDAPWWTKTDLAEYMGRGGWGEKGGTPTMPMMTATALSKTGKKEAARKIVYAVLDASPGHDPAYELLLEVDGDEAVKKLDELFARDRFEERPLIWKAQLLLNQKKLEEAEKAARAAIAIDPSDGEQGHGNRMRVYGVLRDILRAKGQAKDAEIYEQVVKAIRLAEEADDVYAAGLKGKAIKMYEESLDLFADAYCIQSRLAVQLMEAGRAEEAAAHYRKAFELMPDSFGRVESHCFGCEGVFKSGVAQGVAERVFEKLAKETPRKAQVHYLLGYLRDSQGRNKEALASFKEAVRLDPAYLNAWVRIEGLLDLAVGEPGLADDAALNILRLDPLGRHSQPRFGAVRDLRRLWGALVGLPKAPETPKELYPLAGAAAARKALAKGGEEASEEDVWRYSVGLYRGNERDPRRVLAGQTLLVELGDVVDAVGGRER
jgi:tetratricopeptide (TPR) repeat protein